MLILRDKHVGRLTVRVPYISVLEPKQPLHMILPSLVS